MISYNMRYRGPYEYDKYILNTLQYYNEIQNMISTEVLDKGNNFASLSRLQNEVDTIFAMLTGDKHNSGLINDMYQELIKYREGLF